MKTIATKIRRAAAAATLLAIFGTASAGGLAVRVFPDKTAVVPGESMLWNVIVTNSSDNTLSSARLRITLPDGIFPVEPQFFSCEPDDSVFYAYHPGEVVSYSLGSLPPGCSIPIRVTAWPESGAAAGTQFTMDAQAESGSEFADASATARLAGHPASVQITAPSIRAVPGRALQYMVGYGYEGSAPLSAARLTVSVPEGFSVESATAGCKNSGSTLTWNLGTLLKGDNGARWLTLKYGGAAKPGTPLDLVAEVRAGTSTQNRVNWTMVASEGAGLSCRAYSSKRQAEAGQPIPWTVEVANLSPYPVTGARLLLSLPAGMGGIEPKHFSPAPATDVFIYYDSGQRVHYLIGSMAPGARRTFQVRTYPSGSDTSPGEMLLLSANTDSANGVWGDSSQASVALGRYVPMEPDIRLESPALTAIADNRKEPVSFGTRKVGRDYGRSFTIRNLGALDLDVSKVRISGKNAKDWTIGRLSDADLPSRKSATLGVRFKPGGKGARSALMRIYSNDPDESPYEVRLTGRGK